MKQRSAGILLPVFSLPSPYGIGDVGPEMEKFADFLSRCGQRYWQMLPINPTSMEKDNSPYNSTSSMAGNSLFISPDLLVKKGWLDADQLAGYYAPFTDAVDYQSAIHIKSEILALAYERFKSMGPDNGFKMFCSNEAYWLNDFALYVAIKRHFGEKVWSEWPKDFKKRNQTVLQDFAKTCKDEITEIMWQQYVIADQWEAARRYCNSKGIKIFGDLSFYVSYDSADVWAHSDLFCLDTEGDMTGIAGVPPDYFSETGQLWNMPTYNWGAMKADGYKWWMDRLRKNLERYDVVRLDHFRAFEAYWQSPPGSENAINGEWLKGPRTDFFDVVKKTFNDLPFVAEDLGDNMPDVYALREKLQLPGMKVLQFAWGAHMATCVDIPHNYPKKCIVYTGTHDNNTTRGWFQQETKVEDRARIASYIGRAVNEDNINEVMWRMAYSSVADIAILPMQDILNLGADSRINTPGTESGNWRWRMSADAITTTIEDRIRSFVQIYNR